MAYRYVIVEDEPMVQKGTQIKMGRAELPFELAGVADNGKEGLELIRRVRPELVIVDMQMPGGDGMDLMRGIREEGIRTEIIVISAYSDFQYARAGIQNDACDYLVKPFSWEELRRAVLTALERIEKRKEEREASDLNDRKEECKLLQHYLIGAQHDSALPEFWQLKIDPERGWYMVAELCGIEGMQTPERPDFLEELVCLDVPGMCRRKFLVGYSHDRFTEKEFAAFAEICRGADNAGISSACRDLDRLWMARRQAQEARRNRLFGEKAVVRYSGEPHSAVFMEKRISDKLIYALENEDIWEFREYARQFAALCKKQEKSINWMIGAFREFYGRMLAISHRSDDMSPTLYQFDYMENRCEEDEDLPETIADFIFRMLRKAWEESDNAPRKDPLSGVCAYLEKHFQEDLSLDLVSDLFHLSPGYVSQLFSRRLGTTYISYVTKLRIDHACGLLEQGDESISGIAGKCGFRNVKYFYKVFKKQMGETPQEYRSHKADGGSAK